MSSILRAPSAIEIKTLASGISDVDSFEYLSRAASRFLKL